MRLQPADKPAQPSVADQEWAALRASIEASVDRIATLTGAGAMVTDRDRRAVRRRLDAIGAKLATP